MGNKEDRIKKAQEQVKNAPMITYEIQECEHIHLEKIAINHYFCEDCGKIFHFLFSEQMNFERAIQIYGNYFKGILSKKKEIKKAESKEEAREAEAEKKAVEEYRKKKVSENKSSKKAN